ncbi:MAG: EscU/YscU/HrcU family type III secretion system export apparatus switch protein [Planctomycetia bacterium]|nr:EscU/YscU/HrcU family type III secretion system export apparatus switch protein [Planctomycetia bacterium]
MSDLGEKVFPPTVRHREKRRKEGNVAISRDFVNATMLLVMTGLLYGLGETWLKIPVAAWEDALNQAPWLQITLEDCMAVWYRWMSLLLAGFFPFLLLIPLTISVVTLIQTRFGFWSSRLLPDWKQIHPAEGFRRMISWNAVLNVLQGVAKIGLVFFILIWVLGSQFSQILQLPMLPLSKAIPAMQHLILSCGLKIAGVLFVLALGDYAWQYWRHEQSLRMTLQEMREELKITEGDPQIRAKIRQKRNDLVNG